MQRILLILFTLATLLTAGRGVVVPFHGSTEREESVQNENRTREELPVREVAEDKIAACIESLMQENFLPIESASSITFAQERPCWHPSPEHSIIASISRHTALKTSRFMVLHDGHPSLHSKLRNKLYIYSNRHILC